MFGYLHIGKIIEEDVMSQFVSLTLKSTNLDFGQSVLSLPVPDGQDVIVGVVYNTQRVSSILTNRNRHNAQYIQGQK